MKKGTAIKYTTYEQLIEALRLAGLEACELIVGLDFTKSNLTQGVNKTNLHQLIYPNLNPYQRVLEIADKTLSSFDNDGLIPSYGFGDAHTTDKSVFPLCPTINCNGMKGVLQYYNEIAPFVKLSGPTSFVPIITKAIEIVRNTRQYHILLIICDGAVTDIDASTNAIVEASNYPLSIVCVGVGVGPWDTMRHFDEGLPERNFDNFHFEDFHAMENEEVEFAAKTFTEIPAQFEYIKKHYLSTGNY